VARALPHRILQDVVGQVVDIGQAQFGAVERLSQIAGEAGMTLIELSLRWLLSRPHVQGIILGVSSLDHLEANVTAASGPAPDEDTLGAMDDVWADLRGVAPGYNR
jgi:aryl-alcohol dehydrogenase-like predicted oxidoreductase